MARISGIDLPSNKRVVIALTYIYGIGVSRSKEILTKFNISYDTKIKDLTETEILNLRQCLENNYKVEGELRTFNYMNIKRLMEINSYRGMRHKKSLPVRGQKTKTNARTCKKRKVSKKPFSMAGKKKR